MAFPDALPTTATIGHLPGQGGTAVDGHRDFLLLNLRAELVAIAATATFNNAGTPKSGTAGTHAGIAPIGAILVDTIGDMTWINTGTLASPYWEPTGAPGTGNTIGFRENFRDHTGIPVAGSSMSAQLPSGARVFGDGHADSDSGVVVTAESGEGGVPHGVFTTTNEDLHTLNIGSESQIYQPDQHGGAIVDAVFATISALTDRSHFMGFVGTAIDAMLTPATISTTVITNVLPDLVGFVMDSNAGDADGVFITDNSSNGNATVATSATGRDLSAPLVADGFVRYRVEVDEDGAFRCFSNKVLVYTAAAATMDVDEELSPILQIMAGGAAIKTMHVRDYYHIWNRSTS